ncbi:tfoX N-terminal domain protein [Staphylococcus aureus]|uniref:Transcriptional regulator n=2 Tax=Staphylococcus aureus TaxID=1280 RepID=A0A5A8VU47_STAAU|nr:TfoX/Sxy family protein [Staphylococcus aureus]EHS08093.1 TfoX N-terminal domain protein [Staphylococcus aureus subsp. aureus IS-24]EHS17329.1 TfoX N-terminal domain protein [Staphylococcus aureus subsp. aureus IS-91]EID87464.1 TfoX N-terminal domain protein [Staphylococcus aureus subsp. aureus CO-23]EZI23268.1 TfoX N-terminal domain protein [Staphylococcus aureus subsp. aureus CO-85]HAR4237254.1 TfoX/Sxy family protein [Staphylococcus aureus ADL-121]HDK9115403.1 TfoX/Sxy family protein [S
MATKKDVHDLFLNHVNSNAVKRRKMMGEYIIYYDGVVIGGLYDNRLLVKATKSAQQKLQDNTLVSPYPGSKEMILILDFTEATNLTDLFKTIKNDLKK